MKTPRNRKRRSRKRFFLLMKEIFSEWKWLLRYVSRYKFTIFLYIAMSVFGTVMSLGSSVFVKRLIDSVISQSKYEAISNAFWVLGLALLGIVTNSWTKWITCKIGTRTNNEIRAEVYDHMMFAHWENIKKYHSGDLLNRIEGDVSAISNGVINFIPGAVTNLLTFIGSLAIVFYYDRTMAVLSLASAPIMVFSSRYLLTKMREYQKESREMNGKVLSYTNESIQNIQTIKAFNLTKGYIKNFREITNNYRNVRLSYEKFSIEITAVLSLIGLVVSYSCYGWGVYRLWNGAITYGTMTLFLQLSGYLTGSFKELASMIPSAVSIATCAGRIMEITDYSSENDENKSTAKYLLKKSKSTGVSVYAENLKFIYSDSENEVFETINFEVHPGETIALVGPSGEGKSTIMRLLLGIIKPSSGRLYIDCGNEGQLDISDSTRRFCSYVPQEMGIFTGTVSYNLRLGKPDATEEEMIEVLKLADAWDFVSEIPDGLESEINEQATNISRGQAQRLAIARALIKNPKILLMDEATSALDNETEKKVLENIMISNPERVCIITTHRESMLKYCDRVYTVKSSNN